MNLARRISIVGATGSGKTFLARDLAARLHLPLHELDALFWNEQGEQIAQDRFVKKVAEIAAGDEWIIDGHYRVVRDLIWGRADTVVVLNYSPLLIFARLALRFGGKLLSNRSRGTESGIPAKARGAAVRVTWADRLGRLARTVRERKEYRRLLAAPEFAEVTVVELNSPRTARDWIATATGPNGSSI